MGNRRLRIVDARNALVLAEDARLCDSLWSRFRGLMLTARLDDSQAIVLSPCGSVHMLLMRFSLDIVYLDRTGTIVKLVEQLKPYRFSLGGRRAHAAIELPGGTIERLGIMPGDSIQMEDERGVSIRA